MALIAIDALSNNNKEVKVASFVTKVQETMMQLHTEERFILKMHSAFGETIHDVLGRFAQLALIDIDPSGGGFFTHADRKPEI